MIHKNKNVKLLEKSLDKHEIENPFNNNILVHNSSNKLKKKEKNVKLLIKKILKDDQLSFFGFVKKELDYLEESSKVLNYMRDIQKNHKYCQNLGKINNNILSNDTPDPTVNIKNYITKKSKDIINQSGNTSPLLIT